MMKKPFIRTMPLLAVLLLAGCNTMEGLGEDIGQTGEAIEEEASE